MSSEAIYLQALICLFASLVLMVDYLFNDRWLSAIAACLFFVTGLGLGNLADAKYLAELQQIPDAPHGATAEEVADAAAGAN